MYIFNKGTVQVLPNAQCKFSDKKFHMVCMPDDNNWWGITKDITAEEANEIDEATAKGFYVSSMGMLGLLYNNCYQRN